MKSYVLSCLLAAVCLSSPFDPKKDRLNVGAYKLARPSAVREENLRRFDALRNVNVPENKEKEMSHSEILYELEMSKMNFDEYFEDAKGVNFEKDDDFFNFNEVESTEQHNIPTIVKNEIEALVINNANANGPNEEFKTLKPKQERKNSDSELDRLIKSMEIEVKEKTEPFGQNVVENFRQIRNDIYNIEEAAAKLKKENDDLIKKNQIENLIPKKKKVFSSKFGLDLNLVRPINPITPSANDLINRRLYDLDQYTLFTLLNLAVSYSNVKRRFVMLKKLGQGGFGSVSSAFDMKTMKIVALKKIEMSIPLQYPLSEIAIMNEPKHPNLVEYFDSFMDSDNIYISMELMNRGSLNQLLAKKLDEHEIAFICREVLQGLQHLHQRGIIHRDIKAANIMVNSDGNVKIGDFGIGRKLHNDIGASDSVGSAFWMAPEVLKKQIYNTKADIWSFGIFAIELAQGLPPYAKMGLNAEQLRKLILRRGTPKIERSANLSPTFNDFLARCLKVDPNDRLSSKQLLKHPFIRLANNDGIKKKLKSSMMPRNLFARRK